MVRVYQRHWSFGFVFVVANKTNKNFRILLFFFFRRSLSPLRRKKNSKANITKWSSSHNMHFTTKEKEKFCVPNDLCPTILDSLYSIPLLDFSHDHLAFRALIGSDFFFFFFAIRIPFIFVPEFYSEHLFSFFFFYFFFKC